MEAGDADFFSVGALDVSPDSRLLAWSTDRAGAEVYELRFRDLATGEDLPDVVPGTHYGSAWASDNRTFFYVKPDDAMRPYQLWRHVLGTPRRATTCSCTRRTTSASSSASARRRTTRFVLLHLGSKVTDEVLAASGADDPTGEFRVVAAAQQDVEYGVEHHGGPRSSSSPTPTAPRTSSSWRRPTTRPGGRTGSRSSPTAPA